MSISRTAGIPDIKPRSDNTEEARQWNKMREAVVSLYRSGRPLDRDNQLRIPCGFKPVPQIPDFSAVNPNNPGVGMQLGRVRFLQVPLTTEAGAAQKSIEVVPTLEGEALDADPAPRKFLSSGNYEAWVVFREFGPEAKIIFADLDVGPGTLDKDQKAERLATFEVYYPDSTLAEEVQIPGIKVNKQLIKDNLAVSTDRHQFRVYKTDSDKVKVEAGNFVWLNGPSPKLVSKEVEVPTSADLTVTANGFIYAYGYFTVAQHSQNTAALGSGLDVTITNYRLSSIASVGFEFRTTEHSAGTDTTNRFSSGNFYYKIAEVELVGGEVFVTNQIANGPIFVSELSDSELS